MRKSVENAFSVDPSIPQSDLEGSIQQALLMMNHPIVEQRVRNGPLRQRLVATAGDDQMIQQLYLGVLARRPSAREVDRSKRYLRFVDNRTEAIEDMIWVLVNSAEFLTKR